MRTKIRERLMDRLTTGIARAQALQRPNYFVDSLRGIAEYGTQRLPACLVWARAFPIGRSQRSAELLRRVLKIEYLDPQWQDLAQITPIVRRAIGHFDHP